MMENNIENNNKLSFTLKLSDGLLIACATGLIYLLAYRYECGYAHWFDIPPDFVVVKLETVLSIASILIGAILIAWLLFDFLLNIFRIPNVLSINIFNYLWITIGLIPQFIFNSGRLLLIPAFLLVYLAFRFFLWPIWRYRTVKGYIKKIEEDIKKNTYILPMTKTFLNKLTPPQYIILWIAFMALIWIFNFGIYKAKNKKFFLIKKGEPQMVVLKTYGDIMICCKLSKNTKKISSGFFLIQKSRIPKEEFIPKKIGPLKSPSSYILKQEIESLQKRLEELIKTNKDK
jgi:hypothetical protein